MPPTIFSLPCSTAALRIGVADFSLATLSITFRLVAFASGSPGWSLVALTAEARLLTSDGR